jgi:predicted Zn-dependent protease
LTKLLLLDGRYEQAEKEGLRCFRAQPGNVEIWFLLASIYRGQQQNDLAAELTDQLLGVAPEHKGGLNLRAQLYLDAGQPEPAIRLLRQLVRLNSGPEEMNGLHELSTALARAGRNDEAKQVLAELQWRRALFFWTKDKNRDDNPGLQEWVVETMRAAGKTEDAIRFLTEILRRNPNAAAARQLLASCSDKQSQPKSAAPPRPQGRTTP